MCNDKVMRSVKGIYQRFVDFEEQAAAVYLQMASRFSPENPDLGSLWLDMGIQEKQHAGLLQFCLAEGLFAANLPSEAEIQQAENLFASLERQASNPDLTIDDAFEIAAEMEASEVNAIYDRLTTPVHDSKYLLRRKIATSLPGHVEHLFHEACKCNVSARVLQKLERMAAIRRFCAL